MRVRWRTGGIECDLPAIISQSAQRYILASEETLSLLYVNASYSERGHFRKRKLGNALPRLLVFWPVVGSPAGICLRFR